MATFSFEQFGVLLKDIVDQGGRFVIQKQDPYITANAEVTRVAVYVNRIQFLFGRGAIDFKEGTIEEEDSVYDLDFIYDPAEKTYSLQFKELRFIFEPESLASALDRFDVTYRVFEENQDRRALFKDMDEDLPKDTLRSIENMMGK